MVSRLDEGAHAWLQTASVVSLLGGLGTLNMLRGARTDPFNAQVLTLIGSDTRRSAWARLALAPATFALALSPLPSPVLGLLALAGSSVALVVDEIVWARTVTHSRA